MKNIKEVDKDIADSMESLKLTRTKQLTGERTVVGKLQIMRKARTYLEFHPLEESVLGQKKDVTRWLKIHDDRYAQWLEENPKRKELHDPKKLFLESTETDLGEIKKWKQELKFLNYILS